MKTLSPRATIKVADEVWIALALLHREQPSRQDFTIREIVDRAESENLAGELRPGVNVHATVHCVANRPPNPAQLRMLYETGWGMRRLYRDGDQADPKRKGKITPDPEAIPARYRYLLDWYRNDYSAALQDSWLGGIFEMIGAGKQDFAGVDADEYVRQLREGWE